MSLDKKIWWNTIIGAYYGSLDERNRERSKMVTYGDGKEIEPEYLEICKRIFEENKVTFKWEKSDVLLIDNRQVKMSIKHSQPESLVMHSQLFKNIVVANILSNENR